MTQADYLEALKGYAKSPTIYAVAKMLDIPEETLRNYSKGRRHFDSYAASKIAEILDVPPMQVIADIEAEKEGDEKRGEYWRDLARKLAGSTAAIAMVIVTCAGSYFIQPRNAWANASKTAMEARDTLYYVKWLLLGFAAVYGDFGLLLRRWFRVFRWRYCRPVLYRRPNRDTWRQRHSCNSRTFLNAHRFQRSVHGNVNPLTVVIHVLERFRWFVNYAVSSRGFETYCKSKEEKAHCPF